MNVDKRFFRLIKVNTLSFVLTLILGCLGAALIVWQAHFLSEIVDSVFLKSRSLFDVKGLLIGFLVVAGGRLIANVWCRYCATGFAHSVKQEILKRYLSAVKAAGPVRIKSLDTTEVITSAVKGVDSLEIYFADYLPQLMFGVFTPLIFIAAIFPQDLISGIIVLFAAPLIPFFMILIGKAAKKRTSEQWEQLHVMSRTFLDLLQGLTTLKLLGCSRAQVERIRIASESFRTSTMSVLKVAFLSALVLEFLSTISVALVAVSIGLRLMNGNFVFVDALFVLIIAPEVFMPLRRLGQLFHAGMDGVVAGQKIFGVIEQYETDTAEKGENRSRVEAPVEITDLSFCYDGAGNNALDKVSLSIPKNTITALVGASGAGKSTLVNVVMGFIKAGRGAVLFNGNLIDSLSEESLRTSISYLPQHPYLFNTTIRENVRIGCKGATDEQIYAACEQAQIHDFITSLPQGYDTSVGERGVRLSGGQLKRVAIARALIHTGEIVIMDEPTDELDPITEEQVMMGISALKTGRTVIMIAHRLNTVTSADQIVVLDKGSVVACGSHDALLEQSSHYCQLIKGGQSR